MLDNIRQEVSGADLNDYRKAGIYKFGLNCLNAPENYVYVIVLNTVGGANDIVQIAFAISNAKIYRRRYASSEFQQWQSITFA